MKLIAVYSVFNEAQYLEESILSIKNKVDTIVVVDGAYKKFPHNPKNFQSTDGTLAIANKYSDILITFPKAWPSEIYKRNKYLVGKPGDIYIQLDGHEIFTGELIPPFGNYRMKMKMSDGWHEFFRMFKHEPGIEYRKTHYKLWVGDKCLGQEYPVYPHGHLIHKDPDYSKKLRKARERFFTLPNFDS